MKKHTGSIIILIILTLIVFGIGMLLSKSNNAKEEIIENSEKVKRNYANITDNNLEIIKMRKELLDKLDAFSNQNYPSEHEEYQALLDKYTNNVKESKTYFDILEGICDYQYENGTINVFCRSYSDIYEEMVNVYVNNLNNYNNKIKQYNEISEEDYELYTMLHSEYIDADNNGKYEGSDIEK